MRKFYIERMNEAIEGNFQLVAESLEDAKEFLDEGKCELASQELRQMIDGIVQTLELMSAVDLIQNETIMGDMTDD